MKDIVEECGISRGGLYKYFGSTREIFEELLSGQKGNDVSFFLEGMSNRISATDIFHEFF
ncbi:helix-turn-helix domain-containing protein [Paenibacillus sp. DMB20]|uniref:helix-turn-helix domain-containing protein n=1 Tax=Paenibacillus sp. DMB20 TaxID=1642570 RepID=UPI003FA58958